MSDLPYYARYIQAIGPAFVSLIIGLTAAIVTGLIQYRQWRTSADKLKFDLFEKRFAVYQAALNLSSALMSGSENDFNKARVDFQYPLEMSKFLFSIDLYNYLRDFWRRAVNVKNGLDSKDLVERRNAVDRLKQEFSLSEIDSKFAPYLNLSGVK
jgi:hypothetical protein